MESFAGSWRARACSATRPVPWLRVLGVAADITERKLMEQELRSARDYSDRLIETSNAIVLVLDSDANIVTFNRAAEEITGYTREEVEGRNWDIMLPRERYQAPWKEFTRLVSEGDPDDTRTRS